MDHDRNMRPKSETTNRADVDDQIDELIPVPSDHHESKATHIDGPMDTIIPSPGDESHPEEDDASTREELDVDTSADNEDDIIPVSPDNDTDDDLSYLDDFVDDDPAPSADPAVGDEEVMEIAGERVTWEAVKDQPEADDEDYQPINHDSEFIGSSYKPDAPADSSTHEVDNDVDASAVAAPGSNEPETSHRCPACGAEIGKSQYCPECGTDQYPQSSLGNILQPLLSWSKPLAIRTVLTLGALLAVIALLSDSGTTALIISAITLPIVLLVRIAMQLRATTKTDAIQIGMMAFVGFVIGLPLAWFGAKMASERWFETGVLNFGAAGYGGNFAEVVGAAPFLVWLVVGLLIPVIVILAIGAVPTALRLALNMVPKENTGMMLSSAVAAGYVMASAIIFYRPLYDELMPRMTTSQWTLTIFGLAVIRPIVWIFSGAMIGAVVWRYLRTASAASIMIPVIIAGILPLGFSILSLAAGPAGHWAETLVGLVFAVATVFLYHRFLVTAIRNDDATASKEQ